MNDIMEFIIPSSKDIVIFNKSNILYGNKKRFLQINENTYFCFYDGFGGQEGKVWKRKDFNPFWEDYKFAEMWEVNEMFDELKLQMKPYKKKIQKLISKQLGKELGYE